MSFLKERERVGEEHEKRKRGNKERSYLKVYFIYFVDWEKKSFVVQILKGYFGTCMLHANRFQVSYLYYGLSFASVAYHDLKCMFLPIL